MNLHTFSSEIRLAGPDDAPEIAALLLESFIQYKSQYTDEGFNATTPTSREVLIRLQEGPVWVAAHNDEIVGTASVVHKDDSLYVRGMAVLPAARGQRIGESLLNHIERYAAEHNCKRLILNTTPFLNSAIRLYERFGFRRTDETHDDLFGTPLFAMEKMVER
jgi:GNAT superfamily N-acetyltransferase